MPRICVQDSDFDVNVEMSRLRQSTGTGAIGAIASFVGLVRETGGAEMIESMTLEHYPAMTEKALAAILNEAQQRWPLLDCTVIHRVGTLKPGDQIVLVLVAASHRGDAFAACEFIMDFLKTRAPFWKKEKTVAGEHWVAARESDDAAAQRWQ